MLGIFVAAIFSFAIGFLLLANYFSIKFCVSVLSLKTAIPVGYFLFVENWWTPYDGVAFQQTASELVEIGYNPLSILLNWEFLINYVDSTHVIPYWWNMLGQSLFGPHYYAPVFLNIIVTFVIGLYIVFILSHTGFSEEYYTYFFVFFIFHWEVLTWSSFINIKGIFTTLLIVGYIYHSIIALSSSRTRQKLFHLFIGGSILYLLYWTRFYIIFILIASSIAWVLIEANYKQSFAFTIPGSVLLYLIGNYGLSAAGRVGYLDEFDITEFLISSVRILLTPRPWGVAPEFSFLTPSSIFHWLFFFPSLLYSLRLGYRHRNMRFLLIYLSVFTVFYGIFPDLAAARMRFQIVFVFAIFQFHFLWSFVGPIRVQWTSPSPN